MRKQKKDLAESIVTYYEHFSDHDWTIIKISAFLIPLLIFFFMHILNINYSLKFIIMSIVIALVFLFYAFTVFVWIIQRDPGTEEMRSLADSITEGSEGFFLAQYGTIFQLSFIFAFIIMVIYYTRTIHHDQMHQMMSNFSMALFSGISFMIGAFCSALSGYAGMWVSVRANVRVTSASRKCYNEALQIAFKGGYFAALINIILAILGIALLFLILICYLSFNESPTASGLAFIDKIPLVIIGFGFGASFVAMFAQLGGGIYTKAADVGADLIGKVEAGIPEDDPRNPAVIADLVGDNVGDCAGQAADLFESISAEILSAMILGATLAHEAGFSAEDKASFMLFPFAVHVLDMIASTVGMLFVHTKPGLPDYDATYGPLEDPLDIMKRGYKYAMAVGIAGFILICYLFLNPNNQGVWIYFSCCGIIGSIISFLFIEVTQYYTDYNHPPVKKIVAASKTGHATNIIAGLSVGMESTGAPILIISFGLLLSYYFGEASGITSLNGQKIGGLFGTAIATMGMFSTGVYILSMSGFGPIADNAGGIAEMSHQNENVRRITDRLDAVGNVTKANTKGYSVGTASLACFLLFSAFIDEVNFISEHKLTSIDITIPEVFLGGMLGSMCVFVFSSWALSAVGNAAQDVIKEVRGQFKDNPNILEGTALPNYKQCVEIVARAGLREMIKPGLLAVLAPIVVGLFFRILGSYMNKELLGAKVICSFLMFSTSTGILMALFLNNGGGAWDNAKKYIETGAVGGKGSEIHKAAVTGDTVGDPCKDTAGPSIHILIKLFSTITLVLAPLFIEG